MKQLLIISGKGGTGKTTVANFFIKYKKIKYFCDCDVDAPNLNLLINTTNEVESDFYAMEKAHINNKTCINCHLCIENCSFNSIREENKNLFVNKYLCEGCGLCEKICPTNSITMEKHKSGKLYLYDEEDFIFSTAELKIGSGNSGLLVSEVKKNLYENIKTETKEELVIIDGSPGIGCPVIASMNNVDFALIVTEASLSGISDLKRITSLAQKFFVPIGICINKYDLNDNYTNQIIKFANEENLKVLGKIRYDENIIRYLNDGKSLLGSNLKVEEDLKNLYKNTIESMKGVLK
ncbi:MAG TPA: ATP-binding protein [Tissierellaceae bacterium]